MLIKNAWWGIKSVAENPSLRFLVMFIGVVLGTLFLFATGVDDFSDQRQPGFGWSILPIAMFVIASIAVGCWRFGHAPVSQAILLAPGVKKGSL